MNLWIKGLISVMLSGGANSALASMVIPKIWGDYKAMGMIFVSGAVIGFLNYLAHSPLYPPTKNSEGFKVN